MSFSKQELVQYRINKSHEVLEDAFILADKDRWNSAANRLYYACFHMISAFVAKNDIKASTHAGVKSNFNLYLVATGKLTKAEGRLFNRLFAMRQEADYEDFFYVGKEEIEPIIDSISDLISKIEKEIIL